MIRFFVILLFFLCTRSICSSQDIPKSPIEHLFNHSGTVASISWDDKKYLEPEDIKFKDFPQCLIKNNKGLYVALNGSGLLYKTVAINNQLVFERQDSTVYFGDNFDSYIFSYRDTIYSLGGYGFWKTKGLLRYYVEQRHEWEIIRLNREVPLKTDEKYSLVWYDQPNGKLYFGFTKENNNTTTTKEPQNDFYYECLVLDLANKQWQELGSLSPFLKNNLTSIVNITSGPYGEFIAFKDRNLFLDYANNRIYQLSDSKQRELELLPTSDGEKHVTYFIHSTFFSWITARNLFDSLIISRKDLELINEKIYTPGKTEAAESNETNGNNGFLWLLISLTAAVTLLIGYYWGKKSRKKNKINGNGEPNNHNSAITFTPVEIEVIGAVFNNSSKGEYTGIDEINKALGVGKKNAEIQKKQRSDIITSVNKKYSYIKRGQQELIEKRRTEFDKRSFEYFIDPAKLNDAASFIKSNGSSG